MRLLDTLTLEVKEFCHSQIPTYAILSHTWGDQEISFDDIHGDQAAICTLHGFRKIVNFCEQAQKRGFDYAWVDTCCIDKRSSAELSEAINSMYRHYSNAAVCLVHLSDVAVRSERKEVLDSIRASRWLSRGWTLQELIASSVRLFFDADWNLIEDKRELLGIIAEATSIPQLVLADRNQIARFSMAQRISWASRRQTTREEDIAYCLMGIVGVNMPAIYGEGGLKAFRRLQIEIMQSSFDQTLFAWRGPYDRSGLLAHAPSDFSNTPEISLWGPRYLAPYQMTNIGLSIRVLDITKRNAERMDPSRLLPVCPGNESFLAVIQCDIKMNREWQGLAVYLEPIEDAGFWFNNSILKAYRRVRCSEWYLVPSSVLKFSPFQNVLVLEDEHESLIFKARISDFQRWGKE